MGKYVIPAKRKSSTKKRSKSKSKSKSKSRPRNSQPIKSHLKNKKYMKTAKYIPPHKRNKSVRKKSKSKNEKKNWTNDWNFDALLKMKDNRPKTPVGLPNWPPQAPSPSELPPPVFSSSMKSHNSQPSPPYNFTDEEIKVVTTVLEDAFKPSPEKPVLLRPQDLMKSKVNTNLLTPAMIKSKNLARGTKKKRKSKKKRKR
tara:strand:- start:291 stop:890 length:600 start_codon:yes stop_codon:yes gene_type:complete